LNIWNIKSKLILDIFYNNSIFNLAILFRNLTKIIVNDKTVYGMTLKMLINLKKLPYDLFFHMNLHLKEDLLIIRQLLLILFLKEQK
jgi:hypothetical protein